jgi:UPF0716 family protein affecting phage T7 exclusion
MSKEAPFGLTIMEKLLGLIMAAVGAVSLYVIYTNFSSAPVPQPFVLAGIILIVAGILLILAKTGETEKATSD